MRSLVFTTDTTGGLCKASAMPRAKLEVLGIPEDYADAEALVIIDAVYGAGVLEARARGGTAGGQIRITWAALVEKGIVAGVLVEEET